MTRNPRDHRDWTNKEIEEDAAGYLAAQKAYRERKTAEDARRREQFDKEQFVAKFSKRSDGEAEWEKHRREQEVEHARAADEEARVHMSATTRGVI